MALVHMSVSFKHNFDKIIWLYFFIVTELCHAATKIQASFRGHLTRKQVGKDEPNDKKTVKQNNEVSIAYNQIFYIILKLYNLFSGFSFKFNFALVSAI